ncbi:hypothetical protein EHZ19_05255 [Paraburkholderia bannensis]|nr:hypothetical protein EHZ19_05255 [Paraburkholderia bannensis]RQN41076.1 hypothetical protein EHZ25_02235 [Paraburkholderia tropica]
MQRASVTKPGPKGGASGDVGERTGGGSWAQEYDKPNGDVNHQCAESRRSAEEFFVMAAAAAGRRTRGIGPDCAELRAQRAVTRASAGV